MKTRKNDILSLEEKKEAIIYLLSASAAAAKSRQSCPTLW